ncbi:MAG: FtsX-like permease family protein, partial [Clostridia bacterium]|nr:FtsX-like permease family protein [Clostridia bacterium]
TGALDSDTSMQILDILKEIADRGKLVIMVTHSEKIAAISSRVVEISDGKIINDHKNASYKKKRIKKEEKIEEPKEEVVSADNQPNKKKKNFKDRQNLSFVSAIRLSLHNMWASRVKNFLMAFGVAIGIGSLILMMSFSSGITDFINDTMKSYSDPTIVTVSLKSESATEGAMGDMFSSFSFNQFKKEDLEEFKIKVNKFLESEETDYRVTDDKISYGMQMMTLDMQGVLPGSNLIYINEGHDGDMMGKELFPQTVTDEETQNQTTINPLEEYKKNGWIEYEKVYCFYTTPPYYSDTNVIAGKMSTSGKENANGKGGIMLTQGVKKMFPDLELDQIVGKEVTITLNIPSSITHGSPIPIKITDKITGIMDTSIMSGWMVCYIDYEYLGTILNDEYINQLAPTAKDFYKPTHLYIKTDSEETTALINSWLETEERYSGSIEDQFANMFENMTSVIGPSLIVISCISLVVSAMMILVVLYMSVSERTKEIGVLKSIGARRKDIRRIFTSESFLIGLLSGVVGIIFNLIITLVITILLTNTIGMCPITYRWWYFVVAVGVSIVISMLAGLYPANKASKLDPVESLRRE